jgi:hypothetical protein
MNVVSAAPPVLLFFERKPPFVMLCMPTVSILMPFQSSARGSQPRPRSSLLKVSSALMRLCLLLWEKDEVQSTPLPMALPKLAREAYENRRRSEIDSVSAEWLKPRVLERELRCDLQATEYAGTLRSGCQPSGGKATV